MLHRTNTKYTAIFWFLQQDSKSICDFRLPPRCKWGIRSSGMLGSVDW